MLVTEFPMVTLFRARQLLNASAPMLVTEFGMMMLVREQPPYLQHAVYQ